MRQPTPGRGSLHLGRWIAFMVLALVVAGTAVTAYRLQAAVAPITTMINQQVPQPTEVPVPTVAAPAKAPTALPTPTATPIPTITGSRRINVLLLGSDTDAKFGKTLNTQIIIIASIDPVHHHVTLFSIPRDFWVPIPGQGVQKIQLAYRYGGVALVRETVQDDFGIPIDHYAWVGLQGFRKVIDIAGGLNIDVLHPIIDDAYPDDINTTDPYAYRRIYIPAGPQHLDGAQALQYVRSRHGDLLGDFGRSARQQQVLLTLRHKLEQPGTILKIPDYLAALNGYVRSDFSATDLIEYANFANSLSAHGRIDRVVLQPPAYSSLGWSKDGQAIVIPKWNAVRAKVREVFQPSSAVATPLPPTLPVTVLVENGTTTPALGQKAVTYLQSLGYTVLPARNAPTDHTPRSVVVVRSAALLPEVQPLASLFHATMTVAPLQTPAGVNVVVRLGTVHGTFEGLS